MLNSLSTGTTLPFYLLLIQSIIVVFVVAVGGGGEFEDLTTMIKKYTVF
jgi:hypothetical protein